MREMKPAQAAGNELKPEFQITNTSLCAIVHLSDDDSMSH